MTTEFNFRYIGQWGGYVGGITGSVELKGHNRDLCEAPGAMHPVSTRAEYWESGEKATETRGNIRHVWLAGRRWHELQVSSKTLLTKSKKEAVNTDSIPSPTTTGWQEAAKTQITAKRRDVKLTTTHYTTPTSGYTSLHTTTHIIDGITSSYHQSLECFKSLSL